MHIMYCFKINIKDSIVEISVVCGHDDGPEKALRLAAIVSRLSRRVLYKENSIEMREKVQQEPENNKSV